MRLVGWKRPRPQPENSHNKLDGRLLIVCVFPPPFPSLFRQVNTQRKAIVQLILEKRELLVGQRVKRDGRVVDKSPHTHTHYIPVAPLLFLDRTVNSGPQVAPKPTAKSRHWKKKSGQLHGCCRNYRSDQELRKKNPAGTRAGPCCTPPGSDRRGHARHRHCCARGDF